MATTPQDFTSQLRHHEPHESEAPSGPAMSTLFRNIEDDDVMSEESDVPIIEISL